MGGGRVVEGVRATFGAQVFEEQQAQSRKALSDLQALRWAQASTHPRPHTHVTTHTCDFAHTHTHTHTPA